MLSEAKKLEKYNEALCALPLPDQLKRMGGVKSATGIKVMLSADSPENLVRRFAFRLKEVLDDELSDFETGRALFFAGDSSNAELSLDRAFLMDDKRSCYYLAKIYRSKKDYVHCVEFFEDSVNAGILVVDSLIELGVTMVDLGQTKKAWDYFKKALAANPSSAQDNFIVGSMKSLEGADDYAMEEWGEGMNKGDLRSAGLLAGVSEKEGQKVNLVGCLLAMIKNGQVEKYLELGKVFESIGQYEMAKGAYLSAIDARIMKGYESLILLCVALHRREAVIKYATEAVGKGLNSAYFALVITLVGTGKMVWGLLALNEMFLKGLSDQALKVIQIMKARHNNKLELLISELFNQMIKGVKYDERLVGILAPRIHNSQDSKPSDTVN